MGSFKLTAANNQRAGAYASEQHKQLNIGTIRNGIIDSALVEMVEGARAPNIITTSGDVNDRLHGKDDDMYRQRFISVSSQSTLLTTISKADGNGVITTKSGDCGMNNNIDGNDRTKKVPPNINELRHKFTIGAPETSERAVKQPTTSLAPSSTLGTIAEKLKRKVLLFKGGSSSASNSSAHASNADGNSGGGGRNREGRKLEKGNSMDSAHTNTISNSSLQEVDDDEFDSTELAKYMGQINNEIR